MLGKVRLESLTYSNEEASKRRVQGIMKKLLGAIVLLVTLVLPLWPQSTLKILTYPKAPTRETLHRLGLVQGWHLRVPTEKVRDGLFSVQVIPGKVYPQILVETFAGQVILIDGETGDIRWRSQPTIAYWVGPPATYNSHSIFVTRRDELYILDRDTGFQRLYTLDKDSKQRKYGMRLQGTPIAAPVADEEFLYLSLGNRISAYFIPDYGTAARVTKKKEGEPPMEEGDSLQPELEWGYLLANQVVEQTPLITEKLGIMASDGTFLALNKFKGIESFDFKTTGSVSAPLGQHKKIAYIGSTDYVLYALDMVNDRLQWRFLSGGPILRKPTVNDWEVYLKVERGPFYRLDRTTGQDLWNNKQADRFLAANHRFVYTLDARGAMLVHDRARGTVLASYDVSEWQLPVVNELTDRIYLANHDGQIVSLYHEDNPRPLAMKSLEKFQKREDEKKPLDKEKEKEKVEEKVGFLQP
jgi:outer membrane protein assembly factor BamB